MRLNQFLPIIVHALFFGLLGLIFGIITEHYALFPWSHFSSFIFPLISIFIVGITTLKKNHSYPLVLFIFLFALGALLYNQQKKNYEQIKLPITTTFTALVQEKGKTGNPYWPYKTKLSLLPSGLTFYFYTKKIPPVEVADTVTCFNSAIKHPQTGDFKKFLIKEGVQGTVFQSSLDVIIINRPLVSWARKVDQKRDALITSLKKKMSHLTYTLFISLFLGESAREKKTLETYKPLFKIWGIVHHLARSGLHLAIFIFFWYLLLSLLPFPFIFKHVLLLFLCTIYFFLSYPSISFIRACHIFLVYGICSLFNLPMNGVQALTLSCIATLLYNPFQLFFLDFQLSFFLTFCLAWIAQIERQRKNLI